MPDFTVRVTLDVTKLNMIATHTRVGFDQVVGSIATEIANAAKTSMRGAKHGRAYAKGVSKWRRVKGQKVAAAIRLHRASAPGEAPAIDTGNLVNSIEAVRIGNAHWRVNVYAEYGAFLEFGTSRMQPRPFLRPACRKGEALFERMVAQVIKKYGG